jgi:hypothetical protein
MGKGIEMKCEYCNTEFVASKYSGTCSNCGAEEQVIDRVAVQMQNHKLGYSTRLQNGGAGLFGDWDPSFSHVEKTPMRMGGLYVVQEGDSWFSIAGKVMGDQRWFGVIMDMNKHLGNELQVGQDVCIP